MKQQSITFQVPSELLTGIRRYQVKSSAYTKALAVGQGIAIEAANSWSKDTHDVREKVVPAVERDIAQLRGKLVNRDLQVD